MARYRAPAWTSRAIPPLQLNEGNALAFDEQPYLRDLFDAVLDPALPITFVVGAGFSMDAGFPSWGKLVSRLVDRVPDERFRVLLEQDASEPMRKAENILRMIAPTDPRSDADLIRDALYEDMITTHPGPLAEALAVVARQLDRRAQIVTMNFDDVLEEALYAEFGGEPVEAFSLEHLEGGISRERDELEHSKTWAQGLEALGPRAVLHLHGMVRRHLGPLRPVVLTESHFLRHGAGARAYIAERLATTTVIFLGVSLTDPNLVGPLWDRSHLAADGEPLPPCFVLHVPDMTPGAEGIRESREYALAKYAYLEEGLGISPVFFKGYSQLHQALIELSLALSAGRDEYFEDLSYGKRFVERLDECYAALGCNETSPVAPLEERERVSQRLLDIIQPGHSVGDALRLTGRARRRLRALRREFGDHSDVEENFGLFLWLRSRSPGEGEAAPYGLTLVGASTYTHRESWSGIRNVLIEPSSGYPVSEMLWSNTGLMQNLEIGGRFQLWRGTLCIPIRVKEANVLKLSGGYTSTLTVGAIALNTTHHTIPDELEEPPMVSALTVIWEEEALLGRLHEELHNAVRDILVGPATRSPS